MVRGFLSISFLFFFLLTEAQKTNGLVAKYTFNKGDSKDEVGNHHAKAYGLSLDEDRFGNPNSAYYFNGNNGSYLNLGTSKDLKPTLGSISLWMNVHGITSKGSGVESIPVIMTRAHAGDDCNEAFYIGIDQNTRKINGAALGGCQKTVSIFSREKVRLVKWYHVVITFDHSALSLYVDGVLENKISKDFETIFLEGDSVIVGNRVSEKNKRFFVGCIDDIEIYNRVLSPGEIQNIYTANPNKIKWIWITLIIFGVVIIVILLIRRRIRFLLNKEKEKNELRNRWYEQENRVLVAQMDPHFIFNSLNTIQQFIIINDNEKAQSYLSKFSKLLRKMLESNTKDSINLKEEIEIFEKYLEIESIRFNNVFTYSISVDGSIDPFSIQIPRFLIQPVIENAIWHGLLPKDGDKSLAISFNVISEKKLSCVIRDNGVGRKASSSKGLKDFEKNKSLAVSFIQQRLQLMSKMMNEYYEIKIIDKVDIEGRSEGTEAIITLPILN
jgi:hypothetical protein